MARDNLHGWFLFDLCSREYITQDGSTLCEGYQGELWSAKTASAFGRFSGKLRDISPRCEYRFEVPSETLDAENIEVETEVQMGMERINQLGRDAAGDWDISNWPYNTSFFHSLITSGVNIYSHTYAENLTRGRLYNPGEGNLTLPLNQAYYRTEVGVILQDNFGTQLDQFFFDTPLTGVYNTLGQFRLLCRQVSAIRQNRFVDYHIEIQVPGRTYTKTLIDVDVNRGGGYPCNHNNRVLFQSSADSGGTRCSGTVNWNSPLPGPDEFNRSRWLSILDARRIAPRYPEWYLNYARADNFSLVQPNL